MILMSAVMDKFYKVVKLLIHRGANLEAKNQAWRNALMLAALLGDEGNVKMLLNKEVYIVVKDNEVNTPLMLATKNEHHLTILEMLLVKGADIAAVVDMSIISYKVWISYIRA
jgi:ankyrin repeat protein